MTLAIALDAMGGDRAPEIVVDGADLALARAGDLRFLVFGDLARLRPLVDRRPALGPVVELCHTDDAVAADAKPSAALRQGRNTSMRLAVDAVKFGRAAAAVSAGNTGALMAMGKVVLRTLPGIDRPAICGVWPARANPLVMLDLGANIACSPDDLVQFAVMGATYARVILGVERPRLGLLNVGTEELKGDDTVRATAGMLRDIAGPFEFAGFVEGTDIIEGGVDVVVTDGFTGNVALKVAEATARMLMDELRLAFRSSLRGKLGYVAVRPALAGLRERYDPRLHNGAMFVGLNGVVVKSHGGTDALGFANAIGVAAKLAREATNDRIIEQMSSIMTAPSALPPVDATAAVS